MSTTVIEVKNIGKRYNITHMRGGYIALRDVIMGIVKKPFSFLKSKAKQIAGFEAKEDFWALRDVSFSAQTGEVIGIIGRNGAGKSTLLKILSQITPPTEGEIKIVGRVGSLLEVGTGFHPELSGRENVFLNGAILGMTKKEIVKKFDDIVAFAGIEKFLDTPVKYYSSGMYVRLAFSVAAHMEPDILIVDEVLAVGDSEFQKKCLGKMEEVTKKEGRTILFVSHNMTAIKSLCTKTIWLDGGKVKMIGDTEKVIEQYMTDNKVSASTTFAPAKEEKEMSFSKIWITDEKGQNVSQVNHNEDFDIHLEFEAREKINFAEISICLSNTLGVNVTFTSLSEAFDNTFYPFKPGRYTTTTRIRKNFLVPDTYSVRVSAHERNVRDIDLHENAIQFKVVDAGSPLSYYSQANYWASAFSNAQWKIQEDPKK